MMNINKMEEIENFYKEYKNAKEGLHTLRPDIYGMTLEKLKEKCNNANYRVAFFDACSKYIHRTCPSTQKIIAYDIELMISEIVDYNNKSMIIGYEFIDDICAKIVWRMLND